MTHLNFNRWLALKCVIPGNEAICVFFIRGISCKKKSLWQEKCFILWCLPYMHTSKWSNYSFLFWAIFKFLCRFEVTWWPYKTFLNSKARKCFKCQFLKLLRATKCGKNAWNFQTFLDDYIDRNMFYIKNSHPYMSLRSKMFYFMIPRGGLRLPNFLEWLWQR